MGDRMNWLFGLFLFEILLFFFAFIISGQDIMAPSVMFCTMFVISTTFCVPYINRWNINYSVETVTIIFTGIFVYICAEIFVRYMHLTLRRKYITYPLYRGETGWPKYEINTGVLAVVILFNLIVIYLYYAEIVRVVNANGFKNWNIFYAYRLISLGKGVENASGMVSINRIIIHLAKLVKVSGYVAMFAFFNNRIARYKSNNHIYFLLIMIQSLLPGLLSGGRNEVIRFICAAIVEYYILWHQKNGWQRNYSYKYIIRGASIFFAGIFLFYYAADFIGRGSDNSIFGYAAVYLGSGIVLFDMYCKSGQISKIFWGEESFYGLYGILSNFGFSQPTGDVSLEFRSSGQLNSNIYTFFRRPLNDFGIVGMYIFTAMVSFLFSWLYFCKIRNKSRGFKTDCYVLVYGFLYYWIISAPIEQRSCNYISPDSIETVLMIIIGYLFLFRINRRRMDCGGRSDAIGRQGIKHYG